VGSGGAGPGGARIPGRRLADRRAFWQRVVATRYSQVRTETRPSNPARPPAAHPAARPRHRGPSRASKTSGCSCRSSPCEPPREPSGVRLATAARSEPARVAPARSRRECRAAAGCPGLITHLQHRRLASGVSAGQEVKGDHACWS
jgi:hypothetical protein